MKWNLLQKTLSTLVTILTDLPRKTDAKIIEHSGSSVPVSKPQYRLAENRSVSCQLKSNSSHFAIEMGVDSVSMIEIYLQ
jgi:hypothetical protein